MTDTRLAQVFARPGPAWTVSILLALMPLSFSIDWGIKALPPALLFLLGLALVASTASIRRSYRAAWPPVAVALAMIGFVIFNVLLHDLGWRPLDRATSRPVRSSHCAHAVPRSNRLRPGERTATASLVSD